jgi:hypothetical protein
MLFGFGIRLSLTVLTLIVAVRRYGIVATVTGKKIKHAATGRARRSGQWDRAHGASTGYNLRAMDLVHTLRQERMGRVAMTLAA